MKWIIILLIVCLVANCTQTNPKHSQKQDATKPTPQSGPSNLTTFVQNFDSNYKTLEKDMYDSVAKYQTDGIDFSDITGGLEQKYNECNDEMEKVLLGYKLAKNYLIHYDSSKKAEYKQKAEPLFYSFISFKNGELASLYMKLDLTKVQFIQKGWDNFLEKDKSDILFYGLLRGFDNGFPDILKNVE